MTSKLANLAGLQFRGTKFSNSVFRKMPARIQQVERKKFFIIKRTDSDRLDPLILILPYFVQDQRHPGDYEFCIHKYANLIEAN